MLLKTTTERVIKNISRVILWGVLASVATPSVAVTEDGRATRSISFTRSAELDTAQKDAQLDLAKIELMGALNKEGFRVESTAAAILIVDNSYTYDGDISIYDASTELISDLNANGFYHRFSVAVDADTIYDTAYVYARLYLSYEGGPWNHYATSENYHIYGDSDRDIFVIETELADGFPPGYYDVRIELYDADLDHLLFSYGPYDDASLSALPLEDSYFDEQYPVEIYPTEVQVVVAGHGGSASWGLFLIPVVISIARRSGFLYGR